MSNSAYNKFLQARNPTVALSKASGKYEAGEHGVFIVPPLNTNIDTSILPKAALPSVSELEATRISIPETFDWKTGGDLKSDSRVQRILKLITRPKNIEDLDYSEYYFLVNQGACGSCWAYSTSTVVSDVHIVSTGITYNPMISATYLMSMVV